MEYTTIIVKIPKYQPENGLKLEWENNFFITLRQENDTVILQANENGLKSLAKHLIALSNPGVPNNIHIHFDDSNSLESGSPELIIEK
jgi:hypothetical protein